MTRARRPHTGSRPNSPDMEAVSERSPLQADLTRYLDEFNEEARQENNDARISIYTLFTKRPLLTSALFILFVLLLFVTEQVYSISLNLRETLKTCLETRVISSHFDISNSSRVQLDLVLDLNIASSKLGGFIAETLWSSVGGIVGVLYISMPLPISISMQDKNGIYQHFASVEIPKRLEVGVVPDKHYQVPVTCSLRNVGSPAIVDYFHKQLELCRPCMFMVEGTAHISRWGIEFSRDFHHTEEFISKARIPPKIVPDLKSVVLSLDSNNHVQVDLSASLGLNVPQNISGVIPPLDFGIGLSVCDEPSDTSLVTVARSSLVQVEPVLSEFDLNVTCIVSEFPEALVRPCERDQKSTLDRFISSYIAGGSVEVIVKPCPDITKFPLLNDLVANSEYSIEVPGKSHDERLVQHVRLYNVKFESISQPNNADVVKFSTDALVVVALPSSIHVRESLYIALSKLRGNVNLYTDTNKHIGVVIIDEWTPAITLRREELFEISFHLEKVPFEVVDTTEFASITQKLILHGSVEVYFDCELDLSVSTPVQPIELHQMYLNGSTTLQR